jgi:hypothetical protein
VSKLSEEPPEELLTIDEVTEKYSGLWVAVRVVERGEAGQPSKVKVISVSPDRYKLRDDMIQEVDICIFYAGEVPREGYEVIL